MTDIANALEAIRKALGSHDAVSEYVANLDHLVAFLHEKDAARKVGRMRAFLQSHVVEHFAFEETTAFPALLAVDHQPTTRDLVAELLKEHKVLLQGVNELSEILLQGDLNDGEYVLRVERTFRAFFGKLQKHAAREDNVFIPLLVKYGRKEPKR
jgi:hemerythrin-like domain-containing protein